MAFLPYHDPYAFHENILIFFRNMYMIGGLPLTIHLTPLASSFDKDSKLLPFITL